jgi:hypothetical protein
MVGRGLLADLDLKESMSKKYLQTVEAEEISDLKNLSIHSGCFSKPTNNRSDSGKLCGYYPRHISD